MKKKTLQAVVIALGILSTSFTVSAMGKTDADNPQLEVMQIGAMASNTWEKNK